MKNKTFVLALFVAIYFGLCQPLYSWDKEYTHPALSQEAANISQIDTYLQNQLGYASGLNTQLQITNTTTPFIQDLIEKGMDQSLTTRSLLGWLRQGAELEDALIYQSRSQHHFHSPIANTGVEPPNPNAGLDNRTDYPDWEGSGFLRSGAYQKLNSGE